MVWRSIGAARDVYSIGVTPINATPERGGIPIVSAQRRRNGTRVTAQRLPAGIRGHMPARNTSGDLLLLRRYQPPVDESDPVLAPGSIWGRRADVRRSQGEWRSRAVCRPSHPHPRTKRFAPLGHSWPTSVDGWADWERTFAPDFGICQSPAQASSSSSAFASLRSGVSKPSVNQP
jgi:hypothetical protein